MGAEGSTWARGDSDTCVHLRKNSVSVQYPEATPTMLKTVCRVPGQIEVFKSFQGKWGPFSQPEPPLKALTFTGHSHAALTNSSWEMPK